MSANTEWQKLSYSYRTKILDQRVKGMMRTIGALLLQVEAMDRKIKTDRLHGIAEVENVFEDKLLILGQQVKDLSQEMLKQ